MPEVQNHTYHEAANRDLEVRLAALEAQQKTDHKYFDQMASTARMLTQGFEYLMERQHVNSII